MANDPNVKINIPENAMILLNVLTQGGFAAYCVGGFVRDSLLGRPIHDVDIATNAKWQQAKELFGQNGFTVHETGTKFGTITVISDGEPFQITTYRYDGKYKDGRHPETVKAAGTITEDLARRDFTINAMAYNETDGLVDPFDGQKDLELKVVRCVGDPRVRFKEDALRILRACRFCSQLGFAMDKETYEAALSMKSFLAAVSVERIYQELQAFMLGSHVHDALMNTVDILSFVLPELVAMKGFEQRTQYHIYDVLEHTAYVMQNTPRTPLQRWTALFHDMGKPAASFIGPDGVGHFYGHAHVSTELAKGIMERLKFPTALKEQILPLVKHHDEVIEPTSKAVKKALKRLDSDPEMFRELCNIKRADAMAQAPQCINRVDLANSLEEIMDEILNSKEPFSLKDLAINGHDVLEAGVEPGPKVGEILNFLLDAVMEESIPNERDALLGMLNELIASDES
ncbi:MAG: HD domain-containing protein [Eggerthellaceae bacterium]|nr:HD domain-containing protein [Eggerthellaceae bacterium]